MTGKLRPGLILAAAALLATSCGHLHDSTTAGYLTAEQVLARAGGDPHELSVFLCGPAPMVGAFVRRFRQAGIRGRDIHREHFDWR